MIIAAGSILLASGCVYRMNISQGNYLVSDSVSQLKEGMTRSQVRFLLGTPMVPDAFNDERWDYYYFYKTRQFKNPVKLRLTVFFEDEKVARYENVGVPTKTDLEQIEAQLRRAQEATRGRKSIWQRWFGKDEPVESASPSGSTIEDKAAEPPNPVPPGAPLPEPAGSPSGPT